MKLTHKAFRRAWQAAIALLALAIVLGSLLPVPVSAGVAGLDKLEHFVAYFTLMLLCSGIARSGQLWQFALACAALGIAVELLQAAITETRSAEWGDLLANALGVLAAWAIARGDRAGWARRVESLLSRRNGP